MPEISLTHLGWKVKAKFPEDFFLDNKRQGIRTEQLLLNTMKDLIEKEEERRNE